MLQDITVSLDTICGQADYLQIEITEGEQIVWRDII